MSQDGAQRAMAATFLVVEVMLAALVALGMVTGTQRQFAGGRAPLAAVLLVQVLGAIELLLLARGLRACVLTLRGHVAPVSGAFAVALVLWLVWALCRVGEYAS